MKHLLAAVSVVAVIGAVGVAAQLHAQASRQHGAHAAVAHSIDHSKAAHRVHLYQDGGAIEVSVGDAKDHASVEAVRQHLSTFGRQHGAEHVAQTHDASNSHVRPVEHHTIHAGMANLALLKDKVTYTYSETDRGGRVTIQATDPDAITAVHAFLKQQIEHHKTGDALTIRKR